MENSDLKYWVAISKISQIGPQRFNKIHKFFPDMETAWLKADITDLLEAGLEEKIAEEFIAKKKLINPDEELEKMQKEQIQAVTIIDKNYPKLLKEIYSPPAVLYYRGQIEKLSKYAIAVVGTRKISIYGRQTVSDLIFDLAKNQVAIISGLALGVDAHAHLCALQNKTQTVAVLGSGLDQKNIYPSTNRTLARQIIENNGIIVSEYPVGTLPQKHNFPVRNRIISGLSLGTVIIEAGKISGALITAKFALDQNREVFAVPGNINSSNSAGTNNLIKQGANLITSAQDILEILNLQQITEFQTSQKILPDNPVEEKILRFLSKDPLHIDHLIQKTQLDAATVNSTLTIMELKGKVRNLGNMSYVLGY